MTQLRVAGPTEVVEAGRLADLNDAAALVGRALPSITSSRPTGPRLHVCYVLPRTGTTGGARVLLEHANGLLLLGAQVSVVSHFPAPDWFDLAADFIEVPFGEPIAEAIPLCDVIVCGYWDQLLPIRHLGIAPVVHFEQGDFHLYDAVRPALEPLIAASLGAADLTITVGTAAKAALAERYGIEAEALANAVDQELFHSGPKSVRARVLFIGWDGSAFKGIDVCRRVAARLQAGDPDIEIIWVTPVAPVGPEFGRTVLAPSQDELARLYREASVFVAASRYESFPLTPLEAMASGTPVVSTANEGITTYAVHGENALLVPIDDAEALQDSVQQVLNDAELRNHLIQGGLGTAAAHSWEEILAPVLGRLRALIEQVHRQTDPMPYVLELGDRRFRQDGDAARFAARLSSCTSAAVAIPVSRELRTGLRVIRWEVVARATGAATGLSRVQLLADGEDAASDSPYEDAIDLLSRGDAEQALRSFRSEFQQAPPHEQAVIGRWILLCLLELGRISEVLELCSTFSRTWPDHPDYPHLLGRAARAAGVAETLRDWPESAVQMLGNGSRYSEWFDLSGATAAEWRIA